MFFMEKGIRLQIGSILFPTIRQFHLMNRTLRPISNLCRLSIASQIGIAKVIWHQPYRFFSKTASNEVISTKEVSNAVRNNKKTIEVLCPELIKYWHSAKNMNIKPSELSINSSAKIWWKCTKGLDHEWQASPHSLYELCLHGKTVCPFCANRKVSVTNSLATLYPEIASQWHPTLNGSLTPSRVLPTSSLSVWWKCDKGENHVWQRLIRNRTHPRSSIEDKCPFCVGADKESNSLATCRPDLAAEWDYERNGALTPHNVSKSSSKKVWWICPVGHHYQCTVYNRGSTHNTNCPICSGRNVIDSTKLSGHALLMDFFDTKKNVGVDLNKVSVLSKKQLFWRCPESLYDESKKDHHWRCSVYDMTNVFNCECPICTNSPFFGDHSKLPSVGMKSSVFVKLITNRTYKKW